MNRLRTKKWIPVALVMFAAPFVAAACDDEPDVEAGGVVDETIYDEEYGVYEPNEFEELGAAASLGRTVTLSAKVNRIIEPGKAFVTGDDIIDNNVLVVITPKVKDVPTFAEGDDVLVVGKVIEFVSSDIESAYEPFDLDDSLYGDYEDAHAVLAQTIIKPPAATTSTTAAAGNS